MTVQASRLLAFGFLVTALSLATTPASATDYSFNVVTANTANATQFPGVAGFGTGSFNAVPNALAPATNFATSSFTYRTAGTGIDLAFSYLTAPDLNSTFFNSASNGSIVTATYAGSGTVQYNATTVADFTNLTSFLNSTASTQGFGYGSLYTIDLGIVATGTLLTVVHDDGVSIVQNGARVFSNTKSNGAEANPTAQTTDTFTLNGTGPTTLYYARENSSPSVLKVQATTRVPEPASMAILAVGLFAAAAARRRR